MVETRASRVRLYVIPSKAEVVVVWVSKAFHDVHVHVLNQFDPDGVSVPPRNSTHWTEEEAKAWANGQGGYELDN